MGAHDFDFLPGSWDVANRRLLDALDPACDEWETFAATSEARAMLGGAGNVDHFVTDGYEGFSLRLYYPEADLWRIWWSSTARPGRLKEVLDIPFERPRDVDAIRADPRFADLRLHIWRQLHSSKPRHASAPREVA